MKKKIIYLLSTFMVLFAFNKMVFAETANHPKLLRIDDSKVTEFDHANPSFILKALSPEAGAIIMSCLKKDHLSLRFSFQTATPIPTANNGEDGLLSNKCYLYYQVDDKVEIKKECIYEVMLNQDQAVYFTSISLADKNFKYSYKELEQFLEDIQYGKKLVVKVVLGNGVKIGNQFNLASVNSYIEKLRKECSSFVVHRIPNANVPNYRIIDGDKIEELEDVRPRISFKASSPDRSSLSISCSTKRPHVIFNLKNIPTGLETENSIFESIFSFSKQSKKQRSRKEKIDEIYKQIIDAESSGTCRLSYQIDDQPPAMNTCGYNGLFDNKTGRFEIYVTIGEHPALVLTEMDGTDLKIKNAESLEKYYKISEKFIEDINSGKNMIVKVDLDNGLKTESHFNLILADQYIKKIFKECSELKRLGE